MKILIISQYYFPEHLHIPSSIAQHLASRGHKVRVVTGYPNYPQGEIFDGYSQRWRTHERHGAVDVWRVPLYIDHSQSAVRRIVNYVSFALSSASTRRLARGADVVYVYATQMTPALGPWVWRLTGGAPYVLHIQDLWPDSITGSSLVGGEGKARMINRFLEPWLTSLYKNASAVIGIAPTMVRMLIERGSWPEKSHVVYNWAPEDTDKCDLPDAPSTPVSTGPRVIYAGNIGDLQDLETAVKAAHDARHCGVHLTIVGDGVALPRVRAVADKLGAQNVSFRGRVGRKEIADLYGQSDFALVTLKDLPNFRGTIPSKFQAALAHGLPVITSVQGDLRALVEGMGLGETAEAESVVSLSSAFQRVAELDEESRRALARRAMVAHNERFSSEAALERLETILLESCA